MRANRILAQRATLNPIFKKSEYGLLRCPYSLFLKASPL
jgi:hypothetical protein